jgi:adenosine kinase
MKIVCTGSIAFDYLMTFPGYFRDHILPEKLESISLSFLVDSMIRYRGGCAPNIAYTLALLGEHPMVMATVGEDFCDYRIWLEARHVDTRYTREVPGVFTASFFANTDRANNQICSFYPGAMTFAGQVSLKELEEKPDLVIVSPNDPGAMDQYVAECGELGYHFLYDPSQQVVRSSADELRRGAEGAFCLFVNEYEFELLCKHTGLILNKLLTWLNFLVITRGENGADVYANGQKYLIPVVPPTKILDPTGVGDAFRGGFISGYSRGFDWQTCGQMGALAAAYCLEQCGTQNHTYSTVSFVERYRSHFDDHGALDILIK